jgi:transaldolase
VRRQAQLRGAARACDAAKIAFAKVMPGNAPCSSGARVDWQLVRRYGLGHNFAPLQGCGRAMIQLNTKIFADGADLAVIGKLCKNPLIRGFTTNPSLMRKAGVIDYEGFARAALDTVGDRPISFEVFSDEFDEMERQARRIATWGANVYVKIPVTNTRGEPSDALVQSLSEAGVRVNVTAILTLDQVKRIAVRLARGAPSVISIFAGRIADSGIDPVPLMRAALAEVQPVGSIEVIWASPREVLNVVQASEIGCHIITVTADILDKLVLLGRNLAEYSLATVKMFRVDAVEAGFQL